jgi:hypothetical protein
MSAYVGIDVHRKRSQVAVITEDGQVQVNRNVVNGSEPMLRLIGGLPAGTPVAFEAAYGWGWLVRSFGCWWGEDPSGSAGLLLGGFGVLSTSGRGLGGWARR